MITKQQFLDSALKEIDILKHLYGKILPENLDFRPTGEQRSLKELLQYIGNFVEIEADGIYSGEPVNFSERIKLSASMKPEQFLERMDLQAALLKKIFSEITDDQLKEEVDLFGRGNKQSRALWFFNLILKNLVGYKMQLFLYLKAAGHKHLGTTNVWHGRDATPK
jgi:hypothetical protein